MARSATTSTLRSTASGAQARSHAAHPLRVAVVAETFLPTVNGVSNSVLQVASQLRQRGHDVAIIAPAPGDDHAGGVPVIRVPSIEVPGYPGTRLGRPSRAVAATLRALDPDVVHVAAPVVLGAHGAQGRGSWDFLAWRSTRPTFPASPSATASAPGRQRCGSWVVWIHEQADLTLAPVDRSTVGPAPSWCHEPRRPSARGVDIELFAPQHRCEAPAVIAGRAGQGARRLCRPARQGEADRPARAAARRSPPVQLVIVGDGPARDRLQRALSGAVFTGFQSGPAARPPTSPRSTYSCTPGPTRRSARPSRKRCFGRPGRRARSRGSTRPGAARRQRVPLEPPIAGRPLVGGVHELPNSPLLREQMVRRRTCLGRVADVAVDHERARRALPRHGQRLGLCVWGGRTMRARAKSWSRRTDADDDVDRRLVAPRRVGDGRAEPTMDGPVRRQRHARAAAGRAGSVAWPRSPARPSDWALSAWLRSCQAARHDIAQHGWAHEEPLETTARGFAADSVAPSRPRGCAEFWHLDRPEARAPADARPRRAPEMVGLRVSGFVAPVGRVVVGSPRDRGGRLPLHDVPHDRVRSDQRPGPDVSRRAVATAGESITGPGARRNEAHRGLDNPPPQAAPHPATRPISMTGGHNPRCWRPATPRSTRDIGA